MKMKKNAVALGVATLIAGLGFAGASSAAVITAGNSNANDLRVSDGGVGHSLLIPYFSVQNGNNTLINIVNTDTVNGKALKVRFRGASNSDDLFDFQLYLSPGDVWAANINQGADGRASLATNDNSCTLPRLKGQPNPFVTNRLPGNLDDAGKAAQTREGYVEIFNMADIPPTGVNMDPAGRNRLFTNIKHVNGVAPCVDAAFDALLQDPQNEAAANGLGFVAPTTGLFANFSLVNQQGAFTSWTNEATSILAIDTTGNRPVNGKEVAARGNIVFFPQTSEFLMNPNNATADPALRTVGGVGIGQVQNGAGAAATVSLPVITALNFDAPDMSTPYLGAISGNLAALPLYQAQQLSEAIATLSVRNEFLTSAPGFTADTDWTFSAPTRRYSVAVDYRANSFGVRVFSNLSQAALNNIPANGLEYFNAANTSLQVVNGVPQVCVATRINNTSSAADLRPYDTEERTQSGGFVISPGTAQSIAFCGEVSVLSFNQGPVAASTATNVLNAQIARQNVELPYNAGWISINTAGLPANSPNVGSSATNGLPILGSYYLKVTNPSAGGMRTNFGGSWSHRFERPARF